MMVTAILIISIIVSLVINISLLFVGGKSRSKTILSICLYAIAGISGVIIAISNRPKLEDIGMLKPKNKMYDKSFPYQDRVQFRPGSQTIKIGSLVDKPVYPFGENIPFLVIKEKDGLMIYAKVTSLDGKVAAKMIKNKWRINPNNYFRKFHDESALEIIDEYDIPILQIEYIDYSTIKIGGIFRSEKSPIYEIDSDFPQFSDLQAGPWYSIADIQIVGERGALISGDLSTMELREFISVAKKYIKPWFDYYSDPSKPSRRAH